MIYEPVTRGDLAIGRVGDARPSRRFCFFVGSAFSSESARRAHPFDAATAFM